jgi:hypothetical protein
MVEGKGGDLPLVNLGSKYVLPKNLLFWTDMFCIMVTAKSYLEDEDQDDDEYLLKETDLPMWMEPETIYGFSWESEEDDSGF